MQSLARDRWESNSQERYKRLFRNEPEYEQERDLPDIVANRFANSPSGLGFHGLKIDVDNLGNPTLWSEQDELDPYDLFEWILDKEAVTSVDGRGMFDSIFKILSTRELKEIAVLGKTTISDGTQLIIPGNSPWLSVRKGSKTGKLTNIYGLLSLQKEFDSEFTQPAQFRQASELAHARLWNAGLGDLSIRSPGNLIEAMVIRKTPRQPLPELLHVQRFATAFKPARIEGTTFGVNEVIDYDITSAFPSVISDLVDLNSIYWLDTPKPQDEAIYAAIKCDLEINQTLIRGPISVRLGPNSSFFPIGIMSNIWISKPEYDLLKEYPELGKITNIHEASWGCLSNPESTEIYPFRRLLKHLLFPLRQRDKFLAGYLKLSMAALWGKFISSYEVQDTMDGEKYTRSSCLYNPIFASHVTGAVRADLYKTSLGKEVVGEFVDGIALLESTRTRNGFGGLIQEGSGTMVLFDDQYKGCDWKNPEVLMWANGFKDKYFFEMPRNYRNSLQFAYHKFGTDGAIQEIGRESSTMQHIPIGPSRRLMDAYRVGDFLNYSLPSAPPRMSDLMTIMYQRSFDRKIR